MKIPKSAQQRDFCKFYAESEDGTGSALKAGYSEKTAGQAAYNLRQKPEIQAYIKYLLAEKESKKRKDEERLREKANISKEMLIERLRVLGFSQIDDFVDYEEAGLKEVPNPDFNPYEEESTKNPKMINQYSGGLRIKSFSEIDPSKMPALLEISETETVAGRNRKIKLHNPLAAISQLADLLGYKAAEKKEIIIQDSAIDKTNFSIKTRAPEVPE